MSKMEVEIISREIIKPSFPTPDHLRIFKISFIDQLTGAHPVKFISFYPRKDKDLKIDKAITQLKKSLSHALTLYYPLAGMPRDDSSMECNDQGALFVTAHVKCDMDELINQPKFQQLQKFGSSSKCFEDGSFQVYVQFNAFSCGGIAIFFCFSHRIVDMTSMTMFLKCWASISCGSQESGTVCPEYKSSLVFPARKNIACDFSMVMNGSLLLKEGRSIWKRFVFSAAAISRLKTKGSSENVPDPTRVEVVSGFIWKHAMEAAKMKKGIQRPSILVHTVDLRRRMVPPLPDHSLGNIVWFMVSEYGSKSDDDQLDIEFEELVKVQRLAKQKTNDEVVPKIQNTFEVCNEMNKFLEELRGKCSNKDLNVYEVSSWCKRGPNEVDFGFGKPIWTSLVWETGGVESMFKNFVVLTDGSDGEIEAWLILEQSEMAILEGDEDFLAYASLNPGFNIPGTLR